jgi:hypothetical protein
MNEPTDNIAALKLLRKPFPENQISYLPKGGVKLAYVGHAALTDRLLDADPMWTWEPLSMADGLPVLDANKGMWIRLTVCGVTRLGYGHAGSKTGGDAMKEIIGDALRNAAMRFGAALDLWHKGELHAHVEEPAQEQPILARDLELEELALFLVDCHANENDLQAIECWYSPETWSSDPDLANEERLKVWGMLKASSKLRSAIKSNMPERLAAAAVKAAAEALKAA